MIYDLIIIGMGPGGVSAAIYAKRAGLNVLCLDKAMIGGELNYIDSIGNYPGFNNISGPDLAFNMMKQIQDLNISYINYEVNDIIAGDVKTVITNNGNFQCKNVIIATGRIPRKLGLDNELELLGKGISHCAICDGPLYKNKDVAVVGGGNSALQEALYLSNIVNKVYLIHRRNYYNANNELVDKLKKQHNVVLLDDSSVTKLNSDNGKLSSIVINDKDVLDISCLFTYIGYVPGIKFNLNIYDEDGYINVNNYETNLNGIYAIGDAIKQDLYQIVVAISDGAKVINIISNKEQ